MRNAIKLIMLAVLIIAITIIMPKFMDDTNHIQAADEAEWSEENGNEAADAFTIVEIVPYKGMAEIGYLIGGQEPIDAELLPYDSGALSFLGDAIDLYPSYREEPLAAGQAVDSGWRSAMYYEPQNGYFERMPFQNEWESGPDLYNITEGVTGNTVYDVVSAGSGNYIARLPANRVLENTYDRWSGVVNRKNVIAYFSHESFGNSNVYSTSVRYKPYSVTRIDDRSGDYDYDIEEKIFYLNEGHGNYEVIFVPDNSNGRYYMRNNYEIVHDNSGTYSYEGDYQYEESSNGNIALIENAPLITYQEYWGGKYRWVPSDEALSKPSNYYKEGDKLWVKGYKDKIIRNYQFTYVAEIINNEWFKRISLRIPKDHMDDFPVRVITLTPFDLNRPENQHYLDEASLFYINDQYSHNQYIHLYENYSYEGLALPSGSRYDGDTNRDKRIAELNFAVNDLSWESVDKIFRRVAGIGCHKASAILDYTFYGKAISGEGGYSQLRKNVDIGINYNGQSATSCNMAKLYIMIYQRNMVDFYNGFMNPEIQDRLISSRTVNANINKSGSTGSYVRPGRNDAPDSDAALYWNGNTFLPIGLNAEGELVSYGDHLDRDDFIRYGIPNYNITVPTTNMVNNILMLNGEEIFSSSFENPKTVPSIDDAVDHLNSLDPDNPADSASISIGDLINVITNNGEGYGNTGGVAYPDGDDVEGPPEEDSTPSDGDDPGGSNIRAYKRVLNIQPTADFVESQTAIDAILSDDDYQIVNMTSTQFNGSTADISSNYDMVFMGSGSGRFNMQNENNLTVFNDSSLRGYIYFTEGDSILGESGTNSYRYRGNDISSDKIARLKEFLQAGFPIVLDTHLYNMKDSGNNTLVMSDTNIYDFIVESKANYSSNFLNMDDYNNVGNRRTTFRNRLKASLRIIRPRISLIEPILETSDKYYKYVDPVTDILTIKFSLLPRGSSPSHYKYDAYVYIDENADGVFEDSEEVQIFSNDGSIWKGIRESASRSYRCSIDLSSLNGVRQWQLKIERTDNNLICGYVTGYTANTDPEDISILQIIDSSSTYNIENNIIVNEDSLLRTYTRSDKLIDYIPKFTTLTVDEFEELYEDSVYDPLDSVGTSKLSTYHILIMDNPATTIDDSNGAMRNIKDEIADRGLSIIFTKDALGYDNQQLYFDTDKYSFQNTRANTYNYINRDTDSGQRYIYRDMIGDFATNLHIDNAYISSYLTKTNEGSISRYPYQINDAIRIAQNRYSNWATDNYSETKKLIGWYSLADTGNPLVVKEGLAGSTPIDIHRGTYSSSPNDVVNNYYLFSNGSCFYSGIVLSLADKVGNDSEMMLFVNTLIAAYRTYDRVVSRPPIMKIINPECIPDPLEADRPTINIRPDDIVEGDLVVTFDISNSSSNMNLSVYFDDMIEPDGSWDDIIYPSAVGVLGEPIYINNTNGLVDNGTYAIKIPADILVGIHKLTLRATNTEGNRVVSDVWIKKPPVIGIKEPISESNSRSTYIYVDTNYTGLIDDGDMGQAKDMRIVFSITQAISDCKLKLNSGDEPLLTSEGTDYYDYRIYSLTDTVETGPHGPDTSYQLGKDYVLYINLSLMRGINSREFTITATDSLGIEGETSFTLLRRSLFPLD